MLTGGAIVLGMAGIWSLVWQPALASKEASLAQLRKIDALQAVLQTLPAGAVVQSPGITAPLQERVTTTARAANLEIRRLDPQGDALSVSLDKVSFAAVIGWVETLTTAQGVRVLAAEIGRLPEPGTVTVRLLLEAKR